MSKTRIKIAAIALAAGAIVAPQVPALAGANATPMISIAAKSALPKITGDVLVFFRNGPKFSTATITGAITGGMSNEVARLFAQQFPFKKAPAATGAPLTLSSSATTPYTFRRTPALATRYTVELFADSNATTPLATSATVTVFVAAGSRVTNKFRGCSRPTCHPTIRWLTTVPASTLRTERSKRWFVYFGLRFSRTGLALPQTLRLGAGHVRVSRARKVNGSQYVVNITFSFFIGRHGFHFLFFPCQRDTEAKDGLNLPGHHGCGTLKSISIKRIYLG